ncbi:hypothetical protein SESBI_48002 [Sesbania bispinosa]|nr:hypothetical protein SESBI_48002 [Sesbania bispinosa]
MSSSRCWLPPFIFVVGRANVYLRCRRANVYLLRCRADVGQRAIPIFDVVDALLAEESSLSPRSRSKRVAGRGGVDDDAVVTCPTPFFPLPCEKLGI